MIFILFYAWCMMFHFKKVIFTISIVLCLFCNISKASTIDGLADLQKAYPDSALTLNEKDIIWYDGSSMPVSNDKDDKSLQEN